MNEANPCGQVCETCPSLTTCSTHPHEVGPIDLDVARARFEKEAVRGTCNTGRYRMPYYSWGEGPPLLFIHGVSDQAESFLLPIAHLATHFRCIAYDLPTGQGDGARLRHLRHADLVADAWAILDHLAIEKSYVFGSSFGSTIALAAMHQIPGRVPRAILQGGLAHRPLRGAELMVARFARWMPGIMRKLPGRDRMVERAHFAPFRELPAKVWMAFLETTGRTPIKAFGTMLRLLHDLDLRPVLPEIKQPIMLLVGDRDPTIGKDCEDVLMEGLPHAGMVVFEHCGHLPAYTHAEMLAGVVRQFLTPPAPTAGQSEAPVAQTLPAK